jgi:hypothetical protein
VPLPELLTEPEAAEIFRLHPRTLRNARLSGQLTYVRIGRSVRYTVPDLHAFLAAATVANDVLRRPARQSSRPSRTKTSLRTFTERNG